MVRKPKFWISFYARIFLIFLTLNSEKLAQSSRNHNLDSLYNTFISVSAAGRQHGSLNESIGLKFPSVYGEKCGFGLSAAVHLNLPYFSPSQQSVIKQLDSRPELTKSIVSPSGHFRIHYNISGDSIPCYDPSLSADENARQVALAYDSAYSFEVNFLGFLPPPADGNMGDDGLYDIYIVNYGALGTYGETIPETWITDYKSTSFIRMDNDFGDYSYDTHFFDAARVTAAHELHHAIQMGNYAFRMKDIFFHELTSTAMEDFVFDDVNDYYKGPYLKRYFANPSNNFFINSGEQDINGYSLGIWNIFLKDKFGFNIIKRQWELFADYAAIKAINLSLLERHSSFKNELNEFGIWTYFTGHRAIPRQYFREASFYPATNYLKKIEYSPAQFPVTLNTEPLSNLFLAVLVNTSGRTDTIVIKITDGDVIRALSSPDSELEVSYDLFEGERENSRRVVNNYFSKLSSRNPGVLQETCFYNNQLADGDIIAYSEADYAYPNPYSYNEFHGLPVSLPVSYNELKQAEIKIFSAGMSLVYSGKGVIFDNRHNNKYFVSWNGLDSEGKSLPTGVYIYVTNSNGELKKGKIVIKN